MLYSKAAAAGDPPCAALTRPSGQEGDVGGDVTSAIRLAIQDGSFSPNQRLVEADLSEQFGASRSAVRTALVTLAGEGLVERLPNRGARVRSITLEEAIEIVEVRLALETLCARRAAERLDPASADAERLREIRESIAASVAAGDLMAYSELHRELDRLICAIGGHRTGAQILERLHAQSARHQFRLSFQSRRVTRSAPEHIAIIDAVLAGDADAAERAVRAHLEGVLEALREWEQGSAAS